MACTKRTPQPSSKSKAASPEYVPSDDEVAASQPRGDTPTLSSGKRRVREDVNPTPSPVKKIRKLSAKSVAESDEEGDDGSSTAHSVSDGPCSADADVKDEMETPKASKLMGKKKAMNLKTQMGGALGVDSSEVPDQPAASDDEGPVNAVLPSSAFTLDNKSKWAGSYVDSNSKTHLFVKARSADDAFLCLEDILDPYMVKHGHYKNLPKSNVLQLPVANERVQDFTDGSLGSLVPGMCVRTWECFEINKAYIASLHHFARQGNFANASTVDVVDLVFKEAWSSGGPGSAYIVCDKPNGRPMTFLMTGAIMDSFLISGRNVGLEGRAPFARGVTVVGHRVEHERFSCTFATLWQGEDIVVSLLRRHIIFQTRNRPNQANSSSGLSYPPTPDRSTRVGKMEIKTYKSRDGGATPSRASYATNKTYIDWNEKVPVYDGRNQAFDPNDIAGSLARMREYVSDNGEIPEGSGAVVGYTASTSKFLSVWKLTLNIMWIVVITD